MPLLCNLPKDIQLQIQTEYLQGTLATDLCNKYNLQDSPSILVRRLPPVALPEHNCPICGTELVAPCPTHGRKIDLMSAQCPRCQHSPYARKCNCPTCQQIEEADLQCKKDAIAKFCEEDVRVKLDDMTFANRVFLAAILTYLDDEQLVLRLPDCLSPQMPLAPRSSSHYTTTIIMTLVDSHILALDASSPVSAFNFDEEGNILDYKVSDAFYRINVEGFPTNYGACAYPTPSTKTDYEALLNLIKIIAVEECKEYFEVKLKAIHACPETTGIKATEIFATTVDNLSVSQIYYMIDKETAKCFHFFVECGYSKKGLYTYILTRLGKYYDKIILNNWSVAKYHRDYGCPQSVLSSIVSNRVAKIGDRSFSESYSQICDIFGVNIEGKEKDELTTDDSDVHQ